jgi:hypothetical protein
MPHVYAGRITRLKDQTAPPPTTIAVFTLSVARESFEPEKPADRCFEHDQSESFP